MRYRNRSIAPAAVRFVCYCTNLSITSPKRGRISFDQDLVIVHEADSKAVLQEILKAATVEGHVTAPQATLKQSSIDFLDSAARRSTATKIFKGG